MADRRATPSRLQPEENPEAGSLCGAPTRGGGRCRRRPGPAGRCSLHERRRHPRKAAQAVPLSNPIAGWMRDISPAGLGLETVAGLPVGRVTTVTLGDGEVRVKIRGRVCWCRLAGTRKADGSVQAVFRGGMRFVE